MLKFKEKLKWLFTYFWQYEITSNNGNIQHFLIEVGNADPLILTTNSDNSLVSSDILAFFTYAWRLLSDCCLDKCNIHIMKGKTMWLTGRLYSGASVIHI